MGMLKMRYSNQQGVTLVEVLVSMFLLGIAVIGFVALQVRALSATSESSYRSQAMSIAQDLSERMRANYGKIAKYRTANWTVLPTFLSALNLIPPPMRWQSLFVAGNISLFIPAYKWKIF